MNKSSIKKHYPPLRVIRELLQMSRAKFGEHFGLTDRYIESIEYGEQDPSDSLIAEVSLQLGIEPNSLRQKCGCPRSLITGNKIRVKITDPGPNPGEPVERVVALKEFPSWRKASDKYEQLAVLMSLWQEVICQEVKHDRIGEALNRKLNFLTEAARESGQYYSVTMQLDRWIEYTVDTFQLRKRINELRANQTGDDAEWPTFFGMMKDYFNPSRRRRKPKAT
jgi:transcriptional regulator with XRE-family HTH domain